MSEIDFVPHHISATPADLAGNGGRGRYLLLPGSDGRAELIAERFDDRRVLPSARRHNLYLGTIAGASGPVDVATVATGMGCPSVDIIVTELYKLGGRRFLRVGTSGSLQPHRVRLGDVVVATAAVRDESTSTCYLPAEVPAVASREMVRAAEAAVVELGLGERAHFGVVHSKDSLLARELGQGPMVEDNRRYMHLLESAGVLASEMEAAHLFILGALWDQERRATAAGRGEGVLAGAVLGVIGGEESFGPAEAAATAIDTAVDLAFATVRHLAEAEAGR